MTTQLTGDFVLPEDVLLVPADELPEATRTKLRCAAGDVAITRPRSRRPSSIVDAHTARLVSLFRTPSSVTNAIISFSRGSDTDPRSVLERAFPVIERLVLDGVLLPAGSARANPIDGALQPGDTVGEFEVLDLVQMLEDVEVHRARGANGTFVALKIARTAYAEPLRAGLAHEAHILRTVDGHGAPALVADGTAGDRPYIAIEWRSGVPPLRAAEEYRAMTSGEGRAKTLSVCVAVARAYAALHSRGVLHGDVHDHNALIDREGRATLLDFGMAVSPNGADHVKVGRGGVPAYYDPQVAATHLKDILAPRLDAAAEQYSLAALLYLIATGESYLVLSMRREEALRQIIEDAPRSFADAGAPAWPSLEAVLARALAKDPRERFASVTDLVAALEQVDAGSDIAAARSTTWERDRARFVDAVFGRLDPAESLFRDGLPSAPVVSVNNGAAGIAYAFYRLAGARDDATLLAHADAWALRAREWSGDKQAFYSDDKIITKENVGTIALYHSMTGVACVDSLIGRALGDDDRAERSADAFVDASMPRSTFFDLTLGKAGLVLGGILMLEASPKRLDAVYRRCAKLVSAIERKLNGYDAVRDERDLTFTGLAHGWAGYLYTLIRWYAHIGAEAPAVVRTRLNELASVATPRGRGLAWAWSVDARAKGSEPAPAPSWCNGTAGHVHLWLAAHRMFGDSRYAELAELAAWNVWDDSRDRAPDACCGMAGRAYALLALHRATGDAMWRRRAESLADRAMHASVTDGPTSHRLYKGTLGVALLIGELTHAPEWARMPLFESEGFAWR